VSRPQTIEFTKQMQKKKKLANAGRDREGKKGEVRKHI